ncbi:hypothetical protein [Bacteroides propionicifaciens]|nr:hypothetical protein [Bacteroides propionicifaciens]
MAKQYKKKKKEFDLDKFGKGLEKTFDETIKDIVKTLKGFSNE